MHQSDVWVYSTFDRVVMLPMYVCMQAVLRTQASNELGACVGCQMRMAAINQILHPNRRRGGLYLRLFNNVSSEPAMHVS
jgi:hypothetical protein